MTNADHAATIEIADWTQLPQKPLVSVYMLAYRHENYIAEAIEGVIAQQCDFSIELIIGEDCSPDRTGEIVRDYQQHYPYLIRILTSKYNVGAMANSTRCRMACRGKFVAICEGDDYWCDPSKLTRQVTLLSRRPSCTMICHDAHVIDAQTRKPIGHRGLPFSPCRLRLKDAILGNGGFLATASILVRRSVLMNHADWQDAAPVGDYRLHIMAALAGDIIYLGRRMATYRSNVPYSWRQRHVATIAHRLTHAHAIEAMLVGMHRSTSKYGKFNTAGPVRTMVSRYYSDIIVNIPGSREDRIAVYNEARYKMHGSDLILSWLAVKFGIRLPWLKNAIRKPKTLARMVRIRLCTPRGITTP